MTNRKLTPEEVRLATERLSDTFEHPGPAKDDLLFGAMRRQGNTPETIRGTPEFKKRFADWLKANPG